MVLTYYTKSESALSSNSEIKALLNKIFAQDSYFLLESPRFYKAGTLLELQDDMLKDFNYLTVFSETSEAVFEKNEELISYRLIEDLKGKDEAYVRESLYTLRKCRAAEKLLLAGYRAIRYKEYFIINTDGMPLKSFSRLCGFSKD